MGSFALPGSVLDLLSQQVVDVFRNTWSWYPFKVYFNELVRSLRIADKFSEENLAICLRDMYFQDLYWKIIDSLDDPLSLDTDAFVRICWEKAESMGVETGKLPTIVCRYAQDLWIATHSNAQDDQRERAFDEFLLTRRLS